MGVAFPHPGHDDGDGKEVDIVVLWRDGGGVADEDDFASLEGAEDCLVFDGFTFARDEEVG